MNSPPLILAVATAVLGMVGIHTLYVARRRVRGTTLRVAWSAAIVSIAIWGTVGLLAAFPVAASEAVLSHLWYGVGIVALLPAVAVLGARRPVDRAWPAFVLLPLAAVLAVPSLSAAWSHGFDTPLQVEAPMTVGFLLVLLMGSGNYLGTRFTIAALLYAAAVLAAVLPTTSFGGKNPGISENPWVLHAAGTICLTASLLTARFAARRTVPGLPDYDRLWLEFRDTFGIVWAKRVMERVNWSAREEQWAAELTFTGLVWRDTETTDEERRRTIDRLQHTLGWLLKRFVDEAETSAGRRLPG